MVIVCFLVLWPLWDEREKEFDCEKKFAWEMFKFISNIFRRISLFFFQISLFYLLAVIKKIYILLDGGVTNHCQTLILREHLSLIFSHLRSLRDKKNTRLCLEKKCGRRRWKMSGRVVTCEKLHSKMSLSNMNRALFSHFRLSLIFISISQFIHIPFAVTNYNFFTYTECAWIFLYCCCLFVRNERFGGWEMETGNIVLCSAYYIFDFFLNNKSSWRCSVNFVTTLMKFSVSNVRN